MSTRYTCKQHASLETSFLLCRGTGCLPMEIKYEMEMKTNQHKRPEWSVEDGKEGMVSRRGSEKEKGSKQTQMASHVYLVEFILILVLVGKMLLSTVPPNHLVFFPPLLSLDGDVGLHTSTLINRVLLCLFTIYAVDVFFLFWKREMSRC